MHKNPLLNLINLLIFTVVNIRNSHVSFLVIIAKYNNFATKIN